MRAYPGYSMMLEYWVEHYHHVGHRFDVYWRGMTVIQRQAKLRAWREAMMKSLEVEGREGAQSSQSKI